MQFRYDINGLRAIAVLAVVLFHFNPQWLPGGFAGVDVFFVISGFLMTSIIFSGVEKKTFNLFKFYNARANRIIPVLAAMSAVLLVFGWFYLIPSDYRDLGRQVEKSSLFISNLLFAKGGGYFDTAEHTKWLLHTWSLSVEWQFYIFFPILIVILKKYFSFTNLKRVVIGLFLASFIYCIYATYKDSKTAYFLLTSRAWEMLLGGLAFLYPWSLQSKIKQITIQSLGIVLIVASYFLMSKDTLWPGYMALIPVFGAYLIIVSNFQNNFIINNIVFNYVGKWSYSIYVWHWPLVVFGFYFAFENWWIYGIPLSILLGFLSYQLIEKINFSRYLYWKELYKVKPFYIFLVILVCGYIIKKTDGMEFRVSEKITTILNEVNNDFPQRCESVFASEKFETCIIGNKDNIKAIILGDSHADAIASSITSILNLSKDGVIYAARSGCPYILNARFNEDISFCTKINEDRHQYLKQHKNTPIFIVNRYLERMEGENNIDRDNSQIIYFSDKKSTKKEKYLEFQDNFEKSICDISPISPVYIVSTIPEMGINIPPLMAKQMMILNKILDNSISYSQYQNRSSQMNKLLEDVAQKCNAKILAPSKILCQQGKCISEYKGRSIYRDGDHLSEYGNKLLTPMFEEVLN